MYLASDNTGPVHPDVMAALARANEGYAPAYGTDPVMEDVQAGIRNLFEAPQAAVYLVATGTTANVLGLSMLTQPWQTIFCTPESHINVDECNAPEFYTGGAKLTLVGEVDKMSPAQLRQAVLGEENRGVHGPQRGPLSLTNVTERGRLYSVAETRALADVARDHGMPVHLDGARLCNAIVATGASPADLSWRAGVDVLSFGGTKNGLMGVEAVVVFDPDHARAGAFEYRRKRGGHLFSKHRFLSAQMQAFLSADLWRRMAQAANDRAAHLAQGLRATGRVRFSFEPQANMIFCTFPRALHQKLHAAGAQYNLMSGTLDGADPTEELEARFVCDWSLPEAEIDRFVALVAAG